MSSKRGNNSEENNVETKENIDNEAAGDGLIPSPRQSPALSEEYFSELEDVDSRPVSAWPEGLDLPLPITPYPANIFGTNGSWNDVTNGIEDQLESRGNSARSARPGTAKSRVSRIDDISLNGSTLTSEEECPFRPFTKDSLIRMEERKEEERIQREEKDGKQQEAILVDGELKFEDDDDKPVLERDPALVEGGALPESMGEFPKELIGKPIEEIDQYLKAKSFVVIAKRFKTYSISRFSATKSFLCLPPWNPLRRVALKIATHQVFDYLVILTILVNCSLLAISGISEDPEYVFLALYTIEMVVKCLSRGFILAPYTYLRDPWNWLDFVIVIIGYLTTIFTIIGRKDLIANISGLKTFRVLRALKTVSIVPGLKTIVAALFKSLKMLFDVLILMGFCMMVFSLFALQVYMGILHNKCVKNPGTMPNSSTTDVQNNTSYGDYYAQWIANEENWYSDPEMGGDFPVCGNKSTAGHCPAGYVCLPDIGNNPNFGYTSFDDFPWTMLTMFQLITLDFWEDAYNKVIRADGKWNLLFFMIIVLFGSFYLINLMLAVVTMSYDEEANSSKDLEIAEKLKQKEASKKSNKKNQRSNSMLSLDPTRLNMNKLHPERELDTKQSERKYQATGSRVSLGVVGNGDVRSSRASLKSGKNRMNASHASVKSVDAKTSIIDTELKEDRANIKLGKADNKSGQVNTAFKMEDEVNRTTHSPMDTTETFIEELQPNVLESNDKTEFTENGVDRIPTDSKTVVSSSGVQVDTKSKDDSMPTSPDPANGVVMKENIFKSIRFQRGKRDIWLDSDSDNSDEEIEDRNCACCKTGRCYNLWRYTIWLKMQDFLCKIVTDSVFEGLVTICILLNTLCLAAEHYGITPEFEAFLDDSNYLFTTIFALECLLKNLALSRCYWKDGWNVFDFIIVMFSLLELSLTGIDLPGISALRTFRLMRVFKLARSWSTMRLLLTIIFSTLSSIGNLTFILFLVMYMFAVMGMQLFGEQYTADKFAPDPIPRWNFSNFLHSMAMIFRVLCGEWIEPLWDCMRAVGPLCVPVFILALFLGNFMVLNLFLALLLNSFSSDSLKKADIAAAGEKKKKGSRLLKAIRLAVRWKRAIEPKNKEGDEKDNEEREKTGKKKDSETILEEDDKLAADETKIEKLSNGGGIELQNISNGNLKSNGETKHSNGNVAKMNGGSDILYGENEIQTNSLGSLSPVQSPRRPTTPRKSVTDMNEENQKLSNLDPNAVNIDKEDIVDTKQESKQPSRPNSSKSYKDDIKERPSSSKSSTNRTGSATSKKSNKSGGSSSKNAVAPAPEEDIEAAKHKLHHEEVDDDDDPDGVLNVPDCCPAKCYRPACCQRCINSNCFESCFYKTRYYCNELVNSKPFEGVILFLIVVSSGTLCFEDVTIDEKPELKLALYYLDVLFCVLFGVEMLIKWVAHGFRNYFSTFWSILDFCIVVISVVSLVASAAGGADIGAFRALRTLRALRPLRAISRWQGMRIVVNALMYAIPAIFNVITVCLIFWLIFSIMGVQLFSGKFFRCLDGDGEMVNYTIVATRNDCAHHNYTWSNTKIHFNHVGAALLALFQVVDYQPRYQYNIYMYLYFFGVIVLCSFFTLNLFIGVIIDNFNMLKKKYEGSYLDMFLTSHQRNYYNTLKRLGAKKPQKTIRRPKNDFQGHFFDVAVSSKFELAIVLLIFFNMILMTIEHYKQSTDLTIVLEYLNIAFTSIFTLEAIVKIIGLRWHYFRRPWNVFDFIIVLLSIVGIALDDLLREVFITPTLLRVVRVFRIGRVLRLIKAAKGIRKLLFALMISLPALINIGALLFLVMFIFSIMGMSLFGHVRHSGAINDLVNFETFGNSMILLFRLTTSAGWNDVLEPLLQEPADGCNETHWQQPNGNWKKQSNGNCGSPEWAVFLMVAYIMMSFMIVINVYIAVILENFNQAHEQEEVGITEDDFDMFYVVWESYDPHATQFIKFEQLSDFVDELEQPLGMPKPNGMALVAFNMPIVEGDKMHCLDVLMALVKHILGDVEETSEFKELREQMTVKFNESFPTRINLQVKTTTMQRKKEDVAAKTLQRCWRKHKMDKAFAEMTKAALARVALHRMESGSGEPLNERLIEALHSQQSRSNSAISLTNSKESHSLNDPGSPKLLIKRTSNLLQVPTQEGYSSSEEMV